MISQKLALRIDSAHRPEGFLGVIASANATAPRHVSPFDARRRQAGSIGVLKRPTEIKEPTAYLLWLNLNHPPTIRFATAAHELAHLFLGHLGADKIIKAPALNAPGHAKREVEAESVAFIICERNGVKTTSET